MLQHRLLSVTLALASGFLTSSTTSAQFAPGDVDAAVFIGAGAGGFGGQLDLGDEFGSALVSLGDVNGDGVPDLAMGAPGDDDGGKDQGAVWVLLMAGDGSVAATQKISATSGGFGGDLDKQDRFGAALAALGDLDGDGLPDVAVGAPGDDDGGPDHGAVWLLFLAADGSVRESHKISDTAGSFGGDLDHHDGFGTALACLGDLDGDGVIDLAVGAPNSHGDDDHEEGGYALAGGNDDPHQHGAVWVLFLQADGSVAGEAEIGDAQGGFGGSLQNHAGFGTSLAGLGDLDGDGVNDLAVGAPNHHGDDEGDDDAVSSPAPHGEVWVLRLAADGSVLGEQRITEGDGGFSGDLDQGDEFGHGLAGAGDLDADGVPDLLAGAPGDDDGGSNRGAAWLLFLSADGSVTSDRKYSAETEPFLGEVLMDGDGWGTAAALGGDLDGNGAPDLLVGAAGGQGGTWVMLLDAGPDETPYVPSAAVFSGKPGRSFLADKAPSGPGYTDFIDEPVVVVTNASGATVTVRVGILNPDGDINFSENSLEPSGDNPLDGESGDFTLGFGAVGPLEDLVIANFGSDSFSFLAGLPGGGFAPQVQHSLLPQNGAPVAIETGDFDGDGFLDVALAGNAGVTVFLGDGAGGFPSSQFTAVPLLTDLRVGLVDGDAVLDLVTTSGRAVTPGMPTEEGFADVLLGVGDGSFVIADTFATGTALASVLLGDLDQDGELDALLAAHALAGGPNGEPQGRLDVWSGDGLGGFTPSATFGGYAKASAQGIHPLFGALGDLDGDGWLDAVYTSNESIAYPAGTFADEQPPVELTVLRSDGAGGFLVNLVGTAYAGKGVAPILADVFPDVNGNPDAILVWYEDAAAGQTGDPEELTTFLTALASDGTAGFIDPSPNQFDTGDEPTNGDLGDFSDGSDAIDLPDSTGRLDVMVPNLRDDSLTLMLGDGAGGVSAVFTAYDIALHDASSLPPGDWLGGPRIAKAADLDGDALLDAVVYSAFTDRSPVAPDPSVYASLTVVHYQGATIAQRLALPRGGEFVMGDMNGDGKADAVVTQRLGPGGPDAVHVYVARPNGTLGATPLVIPVPAGLTLTGGLVLRDLVGDATPEVVTTAADTAANQGRLLVLQKSGASSSVVLGTAWASARSVALGDLGGDGLIDALVGLGDGRLLRAKGTGAGTFAPAILDPKVGAVGGGAIALIDVNGDGRLDVISSTSVDEGVLDQAFVRVLLGTASGGFLMQNVDALQSTGVTGALTPLLGDMNEDGAPDLVLIHGTSDRLSILINQLTHFELYGEGKPGTAGSLPHLLGKGFTSPGGSFELQLDNALGGAPGMLVIGVGKQLTGPFHVQTPLIEVPMLAGGAAGGPGAGSASFPFALPDDAGLVGIEITTQVLLLDPGAGAPAPTKLAASNGLALTIVE